MQLCHIRAGLHSLVHRQLDLEGVYRGQLQQLLGGEAKGMTGQAAVTVWEETGLDWWHLPQ